MKVVHVVVGEGISGIHRFLVNLASHPELTGANHCLALFTPSSVSAPLLESAGLRVRNRSCTSESPLTYFWRSFGPTDVEWLTQLLREEEATCVNCHTFGSFTLAARAAHRCRIPIVRTVHGFNPYDGWGLGAFRRLALRKADAIVAVSDFGAGVIGRLEPRVASRIRVIKNGTNLTFFQAVSLPPPIPFTFAITSRLVRLKQVDLAIRAIARIPDGRLSIAGDGPDSERLHDVVRSLGLQSRVTFHGFQADPRPVLSASHVAVNCSRTEGLSLSLIEAAAMQRPAVAFPVGGNPEVVRDGHTGWLAKDQSIESLEAAMRDAMSDPVRVAVYGVNARAWIEQRFGIERMCKEYGKFYEDLADHADETVHIGRA